MIMIIGSEDRRLPQTNLVVIHFNTRQSRDKELRDSSSNIPHA